MLSHDCSINATEIQWVRILFEGAFLLKEISKMLVFQIPYTPTPWLTLLLVLGKSRVKQNSC